MAQLRKSVTPVARRYRLRKVAVFGSAARGEMKKRSDVDLLVDVPSGTTLLDLVRLKREFAERLKREVDVVTYNSLHHLLKDDILQEQKVIYER